LQRSFSQHRIAFDYACFVNDLFSYQKEIEFEGEVNNLVLVVESFFGCDYPAAVLIAQDLANARMEQFQHVAEHELPVLCDDLSLDATGRAELSAYVDDLRSFLAGILHWHQNSRRYPEADLVRRFSPGRRFVFGRSVLSTTLASTSVRSLR